MRKILSVFLSVFLLSLSAIAKEITIDKRTLNYSEDTLKFSENNKELSLNDIKKIFPGYEIILISDFDKNRKYTMKNSLFKTRKMLLLNDRKRTFHGFEIYPLTSRDKEYGIKSLITVFGKKNVRLKHPGGDEFEIVVK